MLFKTEGNKERVWKVDVAEVDGKGIAEYTWGDVGGKMQIKTDTYTEGKNIGKKNATTPYQQALSEAKSKAEKKKDKGYTAIGEEQKSPIPLPMLAYQIEKHISKLDGNTIYVQPKLDGIRCIYDIQENKFYSRNGKEITSLEEIKNSIHPLLKNIGYRYLDGELYCSTMSFEEIVSIVSKEKEQIEDNWDRVQFFCFDVIDETKTFSERYVYDFVPKVKGLRLSGLQLVSTYKFENVTESNFKIKTNTIYSKMVSDGYEGMMVRLDKPYVVGKRSDALLKAKPMQDAEFTIVGYQKENFMERLGKFILKTDDGKEFGARPKASHSKLKEYLEDINKYIGKKATVTFQEYTDEGIPRFPVFKSVRWENDQSKN